MTLGSAAPRISVIIATFNRAALLARALESLMSQSLAGGLFEIVVVDDGSADETAEIARGFSAGPPVRYVRQPNGGVAAARNRGLDLARAPILLFMDDDDIAERDLLAEHLKTHARHPAPSIAVLGHTAIADEARAAPFMSFLAESDGYLFSYGCIRHGALLDYRFFWGGRVSCKRSLLLQQPGGFDPRFRFGWEDVELAYRLRIAGLKVLYNEKARSAMIRAVSLPEHWRRAELLGQAGWCFSRKHPDDEVRALVQAQDVARRWSELARRVPLIMKSALDLDRMAAARLAQGLGLDAAMKTLLHRGYRMSLDAARLRGAHQASVSAG